MGPEDPWASGGGGSLARGRRPRGEPGGLGHLGGTPRALWGFKPRSDMVGRALWGQTCPAAMPGAGGEGRGRRQLAEPPQGA